MTIIYFTLFKRVVYMSIKANLKILKNREIFFDSVFFIRRILNSPLIFVKTAFAYVKFKKPKTNRKLYYVVFYKIDFFKEVFPCSTN